MTILSHIGPEAYAAIQSPVTTSVGLSTTYTGLCISNPAGSTVNLIIDNISGGFVVNSTAITMIGLITGYSAAGITAHTTPLTVYNKLVGATATAFQGLADSACTLVGTPVYSEWLAVVASTTTVGSAFNKDMDGAVIIPPGGYVAIGTTAASGTNGLYAKITWFESTSTIA
jgi:hypothetical protein